MPIRVTCQSCKRTFPVLEAHAEQTDRCPHCDAAIHVVATTPSTPGPGTARTAGPPELASLAVDGGSWEAYRRGLGWLQASAGIGLTALVVGLIESFAGSVQPVAQTSRSESLTIVSMGLFVFGAGTLLVGRIVCTRAPDLRVRGAAKVALFCDLIAIAFLVVTMMVFAVLTFGGPPAQQPAAGGLNRQPADPRMIFLLGIYTMLFSNANGLLGEMFGFRSLMHTGTHLSDQRTRSWGRAMFFVTLVLFALVLFVIAGVTIAAAPLLLPSDKAPAPVAQANPLDEYTEVIQAVAYLGGFLYLGAYLIACQVGRSAIQRAVDKGAQCRVIPRTEPSATATTAPCLRSRSPRM